jgi:type 1 glutamine amidotransferase
MYRQKICVFLSLVALLWLVNSARADDLDQKLRVLVITGGHAYEVEPFEQMFASMPDIVTTQMTYPAAAAELNPALADRFDVVVFYDMWADGITADQQKAFVELLNRGIGVVALHHTLAAHREWPEYAKIIGGKYYVEDREEDGKTIPHSTYDHGQDIEVEIATQDHPITRGLSDFKIHDETYAGYDKDPQATVLLTTKHPKSDKELAWTKTYGNSRVVYLQLGHDHFAYEHPSYRTLVARSIRWSAGRVADPESPQVALFNGKDLTGWEAEGEAVWEVKDGLLIGKQGPGNTPGDLFTTKSFADFELTVTYRVVWPANSGVWYRYQSGETTYQADILEYKEPFALSGSLYCPGKMFIAVNEDQSIIDREGWNTMVIRAVGTRQEIYLNGHKTADVREDLTDHGRIGFQVHPGDQFGTMKIIVREMNLRGI